MFFGASLIITGLALYFWPEIREALGWGPPEDRT